MDVYLLDQPYLRGVNFVDLPKEIKSFQWNGLFLTLN